MAIKEEIISKITITKSAEEAVSQVISKVNDGFEGGRVNRQDVASWILSRFVETFSDMEVQQIRAAFFNEIALLEAILKKAKQSGSVPADLKTALMGQLSMGPVISKKGKRNLTDRLANGQLKEEEGVA